MKNLNIAIITILLLSFLSFAAAMHPKEDGKSVMTPVIIEFNEEIDENFEIVLKSLILKVFYQINFD